MFISFLSQDPTKVIVKEFFKGINTLWKMRRYGGVVNAFSRVRKSWCNVYTRAVETPQRIQERPGIQVQQGVGRRYWTENRENESLGLVIAT